MDRYLICVSVDDKLSELWRLALQYHSYLKYVDKKKYDIEFLCVVPNEFRQPTDFAKRLAKKLPMRFVPDYIESMPCIKGGDAAMFSPKYLSPLYEAVPNLDGRHLILLDSDILFLPQFNDWYTIVYDADIVMEQNVMHRGRVQVATHEYNYVYAKTLDKDKTIIAPSFILNNRIAEQFLRQYKQVVEDLPSKRSAVMCAKGLLVQDKGYHFHVIPQFIDNIRVLADKWDMYNYTNLHYYACCPIFDKRHYTTEVPWQRGLKRPELWRDKGYHTANWIWETVDEYCASRQFIGH